MIRGDGWDGWLEGDGWKEGRGYMDDGWEGVGGWTARLQAIEIAQK